MIPALDQTQQRRIIASARLLDSEPDRQAAFHAIGRLLPSGLTIADLLAQALSTPPALTAWQRKAKAIVAAPAGLTDRDRRFLRDIARRHREPTPKQQAWLDDLAERFGV